MKRRVVIVALVLCLLVAGCYLALIVLAANTIQPKAQSDLNVEIKKIMSYRFNDVKYKICQFDNGDFVLMAGDESDHTEIENRIRKAAEKLGYRQSVYLTNEFKTACPERPWGKKIH
jgi:hypothetical protein